MWRTQLAAEYPQAMCSRLAEAWGKHLQEVKNKDHTKDKDTQGGHQPFRVHGGLRPIGGAGRAPAGQCGHWSSEACELRLDPNMVHIGWNKLVNLKAAQKARQGEGFAGPLAAPTRGTAPTDGPSGVEPRGPRCVAQLPGGATLPCIDPILVRAPWRPETGKQARDALSDACVGGLRNPNCAIASNPALR